MANSEVIKQLRAFEFRLKDLDTKINYIYRSQRKLEQVVGKIDRKMSSVGNRFEAVQEMMSESNTGEYVS